MILAHHGGEASLVLAMVMGAGAVPPLLLLVRTRLRAVGSWLRRRKPRK
jgi:hypothetical protein